MKRYLGFAALLAIAAGVAVTGGCGGGGGGSGPATASVAMDIHWAARSRTLNAPASAQSVVLTMKQAGVSGADFKFTVNRASTPGEYTDEYVSKDAAKVGQWDSTVTFFAETDGKGAAVASAQAPMNLKADGSCVGTFSVACAVASVEVPAGQEVEIGHRKDVSFVAKDAKGAIVALPAGAAFWQIVDGQAQAVLINGQMEGLAIGKAKVVVSVDGKASPTQVVNIVFHVADLAGSFAGNWFANSPDSSYGTQRGSLSVTLAADGTITGKLRNQYENYALDGKWTATKEPAVTGTLARNGDLSLTVTYAEFAYQITGQVSRDSQGHFSGRLQFPGGYNNNLWTFVPDLDPAGSGSIIVQ